MKIKAEKVTDVFNPIEVTFIIQTEEELEALATMSRLNSSIPAQLVDKNKGDIVADFLNMLRNSISQYH